MRIAVVGGGISGLAAAYRLRQALPQARLTVFEAGPRWGGVIASRHLHGALCELGPDSLLRKPAALALIHDLGLDGELLETRRGARRALIVQGQELLPIPEGFYLLAPGRLWPFLRSPLLSPLGKLRMALDLLLPARAHDAPDESLAGFVRRRLGAEALERLAQPLVAGITTADPELLSVAAVFPQLVAMESRHRSLLVAMRDRLRESPASGARYGLFITLAGGMQRLTDALVASLALTPAVCTLQASSAITALEFTTPPRPVHPHPAVRLTTTHGSWEGDRVVLALPAHASARLLERTDPALAALLASIPYAPVATVNLGWPRSHCPRLPEAAGFVVPAVEGRALIAATFADRKFAGRAAPDQVLVRAFLGGALRPEVLALADDELAAVAAHEVAELLRIAAPPAWSLVARYPQAMPQYTVGHQARLAAIAARAARHAQLALLGNGFTGIGIGELCAAADALCRRWKE